MPTTKTIILTITIMALITYLCRMLPMVIFRKKISNIYVRSFLIYLPYGVLTAMVFPAVFFATENIVSGIVGMVVATLLSRKKKGLATVALLTTLAVFIVGLWTDYFHLNELFFVG